MPNLIKELACDALAFYSNSPFTWDGPGRRACFANDLLLPIQDTTACQWECGDCTGRALDGFIYLRELTGDEITGRTAEEGLREFAHSLIDTSLGLACVPENRHPVHGNYYHLWDQGRMLRYLVHKWEVSDGNEKELYIRRIERLIEGLKLIAVKSSFDGFGECLWFATDVYYDDGPDYKTPGWVPRAAQFIQPLVRCAVKTGREDILKIAIHLANGFISEYELGPYRDLKRSEPCCTTDGRLATGGVFSGHVHGHLAGLIGLAELALAIGNTSGAKKYLDIVEKSWRWVIDETTNGNPGSLFGWIPEGNYNDTIRSFSEYCCTADWAELSNVLFRCAVAFPEYGFFADACDYSEATFYNATATSMIRMTDNDIDCIEKAFENNLACHSFTDAEKAMILSNPERRLYLKSRKGVIAGGRTPIDLIFRHNNGRLQLPCTGCCSYSSARALYAAWDSILIEESNRTFIAFPYNRATSRIMVSERRGGGLVYRNKGTSPVMVHIPYWTDKKNIGVASNHGVMLPEFSADNRWIVIKGTDNTDSIEVSWPLVKRKTTHRIGVKQGIDRDMPNLAGNHGEFHANWLGNRIISYDGKAEWLPIIRLENII